MLRSSNPALSVFGQASSSIPTVSFEDRPRTMTVGGTVTATLILLGVLTCSAVGGWTLAATNPGLMAPMWIGAALASLAIFFVLRSKPQWSPWLGFVFAVVQGLFVGAISVMIEGMVFKKASGATATGSGIVIQALLLTFGIAFALLLGYKLGVIRVRGALARMVTAATGGVMFLYIAVFAWSLIGPAIGMGGNIPYLHELFKLQGAGWIGIGFSLFVIGLASFSLVMDFQAIEEMAQGGAPKYMEWYGAYTLLVTLVWLYIEILKLLAKLRGRE